MSKEIRMAVCCQTPWLVAVDNNKSRSVVVASARRSRHGQMLCAHLFQQAQPHPCRPHRISDPAHYRRLDPDLYNPPFAQIAPRQDCIPNHAATG